ARALGPADDVLPIRRAAVRRAVPGRRLGGAGPDLARRDHSGRHRRSRARATICLGAVTAVPMGGCAAALAIRSGSMSLMQSVFPFVFIFLFTAPAFFPRELLHTVLHDAAACTD